MDQFSTNRDQEKLTITTQSKLNTSNNHIKQTTQSPRTPVCNLALDLTIYYRSIIYKFE